jgi:hypothetical protein
MGKKIFVSYKYADKLVMTLPSNHLTTVRDYVDVLKSKIDQSDHIYKGEDDDEDMSFLADSTIGSKLGDIIFDTTVTIVFISKGMKDANVPEKDQWIPWEISYSLKEQSRQYGNSKTNAVLAVVLPDNTNSYEYFISKNTCPYCNCSTLQTSFLFKILKENMFNIKMPQFSTCSNHPENKKPYTGYSSYIFSVKWDDFINNINHYIEQAVEIWRHRDDYNIVQSI